MDSKVVVHGGMTSLLMPCVNSTLNFFARKSEPEDIWMRKSDKVYEYVAVYVDNLAIVMKDPQEFSSILEGKYKFKTKGSGPLSFHLGINFHRDYDGNLFSR